MSQFKQKEKKLTFYINMYIFFETMSLIFEELSAVFLLYFNEICIFFVNVSMCI